LYVKENTVKSMRWICVAFLVLAVPYSAFAYPPSKGASKDCTTCHKADKKEVETLVKKLSPNLTVLDIKLAPVMGLWQVEIDGGEGKRGVLFFDFAKKYILVLNQLIPVDQIGKPKKVDASKIPMKDAMLLGDPAAKKKVAVFTDPDCPYCRSLHEEMKKVIEKRKDIAFHVFLFPLPMHKDAYKKAQAVLCEKSLALLDDAFGGKDVPEPKCGSELLEKNLALGKELGINGTPTLVRDDGILLGGTLPADKLIDWIDGK
jgi:thiol:disulfide interchange protein DsbC